MYLNGGMTHAQSTSLTFHQPDTNHKPYITVHVFNILVSIAIPHVYGIMQDITVDN